MIKYFKEGDVIIMVEEISISWSETKKNVESIISKYIYYTFSYKYMCMKSWYFV